MSELNGNHEEGNDNREVQKSSDLQEYSPEKIRKPVSKIRQIWLAFLALFIMAGMTYAFYKLQGTNSNGSEEANLIGDYFDPTGVVLGSPENIFTIYIKGGRYIGRDEKGTCVADFVPMGSGNYSAQVSLHGIQVDFEVHLYEKENKLTFFNSFTKSSWHLTRSNK